MCQSFGIPSPSSSYSVIPTSFDYCAVVVGSELLALFTMLIISNLPAPKLARGSANAPLVVRGCPQIPGLDHKALCRVDVILIADLLDAHLDAIFGEDEVLLAHALGGRFGHLADAEVDLVADPGADADNGEDDYEGEDLTAQEDVSKFIADQETRVGGEMVPDRRRLLLGATPRHGYGSVYRI